MRFLCAKRRDVVGQWFSGKRAAVHEQRRRRCVDAYNRKHLAAALVLRGGDDFTYRPTILARIEKLGPQRRADTIVDGKAEAEQALLDLAEILHAGDDLLAEVAALVERDLVERLKVQCLGYVLAGGAGRKVNVAGSDPVCQPAPERYLSSAGFQGSPCFCGCLVGQPELEAGDGATGSQGEGAVLPVNDAPFSRGLAQQVRDRIRAALAADGSVSSSIRYPAPVVAAVFDEDVEPRSPGPYNLPVPSPPASPASFRRVAPRRDPLVDSHVFSCGHRFTGERMAATTTALRGRMKDAGMPLVGELLAADYALDRCAVACPGCVSRAVSTLAAAKI